MGLKLEYQNFPIAGRGGIVRFFMQIHDIEFEDEVVDMSADWKALKEELVSSGRNPCGTLPVVTDGEHDMSQHIAVTKYLARVYRVTSGDPWKDYVQDLVADEYQGWRAKWVTSPCLVFYMIILSEICWTRRKYQATQPLRLCMTESQVSLESPHGLPRKTIRAVMGSVNLYSGGVNSSTSVLARCPRLLSSALARRHSWLLSLRWLFPLKRQREQDNSETPLS